MVSEGCMLRRTVLWYLVFTGCGMNYMIRTNFNIAIIAMVINPGTEETNTSLVSECYKAAPKELDTNTNISSNNTTDFAKVSHGPSSARYDWDEYKQTQLLGAFFWTYWLNQMTGGILAQKYGSKYVFGFSNLFLIVTTFLIPLFAMIDYRALVTLRVLQGLIGGLAWPSLHDLAGKWIPPDERSHFVTAYMGSSVGAALTYPLCGLIIHSLGWEAVFYITGAIGILWFGAWWWLVYDSPADHPHISEKELQYIQESLAGAVSKRKPPIPWMKIATSVPLWVLIIAHWGCLWGMFTMLILSPTYFQVIHGWSIRMTGLLSGIPHICRLVLALVVSYGCDSWLKSNTYSYTTVRKIAMAICTTLQGILTLGLAFCGCNSTAAIVFLTAAVTVSGAEAPGPLASYVDMAPNFASVVMGIGNMVTVIPGFISPIIVGVLTYQNQTTSTWQVVFLISAAMAFIPGMLYTFIGTSVVQPWNAPEVPETELQILHSKQLKNKEEKNVAVDHKQKA